MGALSTAEDTYGAATGAGIASITAPEVCVVRHWVHRKGNVPAQMVGQPKGPMPTETAGSPVAVAVVNHGRWTVECPFGCRSAQIASEADRRFFCVECGNADTGRWVAVRWPEDIEAIDAALSLRPDMATRNWVPPETAADLLAENAERGL